MIDNIKDLTIVFVDDEQENLFLFKRQFKTNFNIELFDDPNKAFKYIIKNDPIALVVTDQVMPSMTGLELCEKVQEIKSTTFFIMITGNPENDDDLMYKALQQNKFYDFINKPLDFENQGSYYEKLILTCLHNYCLEKTKENYNIGYMLLLTRIIDLKDEYTHHHSKNVADFSVLFAKEVYNFDQARLNRLKMASQLHDIGKIAIPLDILSKKEKLTDEEFQTLRTHPQEGLKLMSGINELEEIIELGAYHHEKWDGSGYPDGLKGENIPMEARIIGLWDAFDAMHSPRVYKNSLTGRTYEESIEEVKRCAGSHFDPEMVGEFLKFISNHPEIKEMYKHLNQKSLDLVS